MYKASDFTNGKMNEIFKAASSERRLTDPVGRPFNPLTIINHKQMGDFALIGREWFAIKSTILHEALTGVSIKEFYATHGDGVVGADGNQLKAMNLALGKKDVSTHLDWAEVYAALAERLAMLIIYRDPLFCEKAIKTIAGESNDK